MGAAKSMPSILSSLESEFTKSSMFVELTYKTRKLTFFCPVFCLSIFLQIFLEADNRSRDNYEAA